MSRRRGVPPQTAAQLLTAILRRSVVREDGCWEWRGATNGRYGYIRVPRGIPGVRPGVRRVHRVALECFYRRPCGEIVHHRCPNKLCWCPMHLQELTCQHDHYLCDWRMRRALEVQRRHIRAIGKETP